MNDMTMDDLTPENLDRIAKALQKDQLPDDDYHAQWKRELTQRLKAVIDMFDDGNDVIIQAKLGDQIPRMFEKMMDNVADRATQVKRERAKHIRNDVGIEITQNTIEQSDEQLERLRVQWWTLNEAFKVARGPVRQHAIDVSGISFGAYTRIKDLPKVQRMRARKGQLTMETYQANKDDFWQFARDTGLVEAPTDQDHGADRMRLE
jgi:hypothetical protein